MQKIIQRIMFKAKSLNKHIVFAEGEDERVLQAAALLTSQCLARVTLLGRKDVMQDKAIRLGISIARCICITPSSSDLLEHYANALFQKRQAKGLTLEDARKLVLQPMYFAVMMLDAGHVDGVVGGATTTSADTIRPALQIIKTKPGVDSVSSCFLMVLPDRDDVFIFSDCAVVPHPDANQLMHSALLAAQMAESFTIQPRIALLSFSTKGSAQDSSLQKIIDALAKIKTARPDLIVDGELQLDAAIVPEVARRKAPHSPIQGNANILIFPTLNAANIGYKLVERFGHARPIGPILLGLQKPVNDVSRGCDVDQLVLTACMTAIEADFS